jgi:hypothetical protein
MNAQLSDIPGRFRDKAIRSVNSLRPVQPAPTPTQRYKLILWGVAIPAVVVFVDVMVDAIARGQRR